MKKIRVGYKITEIGEIPEEWEVSRLEDKVDIRSGNSPTEFELMEVGKYPFFKVDDMNYTTKYMSIAKVYFNECRYKLMPKGMVVFPKRGASIFTNKVAILEDEGYFDTNTMGLICKNGLQNEFLFYQLKFIGLERFADTTAIPQINNKHINPLIIPIPNFSEQEKIAAILSTVDEQIDNVDGLIEKNKELKKGLMQKLLTKGISHTKFKKTEIGEIPEAWEVKKLEDVFEILDNMRKPIKASERENMKGNIPYYGASGIIDWVNDYIFDDELILLGEDGENLNSRNTDLAFKVTGKSWVNNHAHVFKVSDKNKCNIDFMVYYLEAKDYSIYIAGSAQPKITQAQCRKFLLPLPKKVEQDKISSILLSVDKKIEEYKIKKQKLEELKKGLMQQLLTGKIRVI